MWAEHASVNNVEFVHLNLHDTDHTFEKQNSMDTDGRRQKL